MNQQIRGAVKEWVDTMNKSPYETLIDLKENNGWDITDLSDCLGLLHSDTEKVLAGETSINLVRMELVKTWLQQVSLSTVLSREQHKREYVPERIQVTVGGPNILINFFTWSVDGSWGGSQYSMPLDRDGTWATCVYEVLRDEILPETTHN